MYCSTMCNIINVLVCLIVSNSCLLNFQLKYVFQLLYHFLFLGVPSLSPFYGHTLCHTVASRLTSLLSSAIKSCYALSHLRPFLSATLLLPTGSPLGSSTLRGTEANSRFVVVRFDPLAIFLASMEVSCSIFPSPSLSSSM